MNDMQQIEQEFRESWKKVIEFFTFMLEQTSEKYYQAMLDIISHMKQQGYDSKFRAGIQMSTLIISRARVHGMQGGQAFIRFAISHTQLQVSYVESFDNQSLTFDTFEYNSEIDRMVQWLLKKPIN